MKYERIKELRLENHLTQKELSEKLNITERKYSFIERGEQVLQTNIILKLVKYYNVSVDYLLGLTDNPKPYK